VSDGQYILNHLLTAVRTDRLDQICLPHGIYIPGRFKRIYVGSLDYGVPYITGGSILKINPLTESKILSQKQVEGKPELLLREKMILVTCSGVIGNSTYVSPLLKGTVGSPDLIRIIADSKLVLPGYLFAFLNSNIGRALIEQKTYGAVIPHIEAHHLFSLPIPRLDVEKETQISNLVDTAFSNYASALKFEEQAQLSFRQALQT
jgi:type I restriction enzyme S subunit